MLKKTPSLEYIYSTAFSFAQGLEAHKWGTLWLDSALHPWYGLNEWLALGLFHSATLEILQN